MKCACGCGELAPLATRTRPHLGYIKGQPLRYLPGHILKGQNHYNWQGGKYTNYNGRTMIRVPGYPRADKWGYVQESIYLSERALGKALPDGTQVHHYTATQLVICQDDSYHKFLHQRQRAYESCGHSSWLKCAFCKQYDAPEHLYMPPGKNRGWHRSCKKEYRQRRKA